MNPAPPPLPRISPKDRRLKIGCLTVFLVLILAAPAGIIALYWFEGWQGDRAWADYKAAATARGTKLYLAEYEQPAIPDEENYAAAAIFRELTDPVTGKESLRALALPKLPTRGAVASTKGSNPQDSDRLVLYQDAFFREGWIPAKTESAANDVLTALQRWEGRLAEIRQASQRPKSQWPLQLNKAGIPEYSYINPVLTAMTALHLRASALLALQRVDEAHNDMTLLLRAAESLEQESTTLPFLFRMAIWGLWLDVAERGIASKAWNNTHLQSLAEECSKVDVLAALVHAFDSERTFGNTIREAFAKGDRTELANLLNPSTTGSSETPPFLFLMPRGWLRRDQVEYNRLIDLDIADIHVADGTIDPRFSRSATIAKGYTTIYQRLTHFLTVLTLPVNEGTGYRAADTHTSFQQVRVECALARYRNTHPEYPTSLDVLVPDFIDRVPIDVMDGQPLRYRRSETGGYLLWSIGRNRIDDGGKSGPEGQAV